MEDIEKLAQKLRRLPNKTEFCQKHHLNRATVYRIIGGWNNPTHRTLLKIEKALAKDER